MFIPALTLSQPRSNQSSLLENISANECRLFGRDLPYLQVAKFVLSQEQQTLMLPALIAAM